MEVANPNDMRGLAVIIGKKLGPSVVVLGAAIGKKANVLALCSAEAIEKGHKAGDIVREITTKLGGKGGGKPDFAMGGAPSAEGLKDALQ